MLAERQHGVVSLAQLEALGMTATAVRKRVARGSLYPVHRGVYAVGHRVLPSKGRLMAAALGCGRGAVLSHRSAAALWGIHPGGSGRVEVSSPGRTGRKLPGISVHSGATLEAEDVAVSDGIPCTTVARTLLDLAEVAGQDAAERACERAEALRLFDLAAVQRILERAAGRRGAPPLRAAIAAWRPEASLTRKELERRPLNLCASLPARPEVNAWVELPGGGVEVDFLWPGDGLAVETDGHAVHGTRRAFERDRRRDQRLPMAGFRVARFTWRQVAGHADELAATLDALLAR